MGSESRLRSTDQQTGSQLLLPGVGVEKVRQRNDFSSREHALAGFLSRFD
jgi:hypothetical protein